MSERIPYFGYGANRDPKMLAVLFGRPEAELIGQPAFLDDYGLAVQRLDQVPDIVVPTAPAPVSARDLLKEHWDDSFKSYVIMPSPGDRVFGTVWELTPDERERVRDWELIDFGWYEDCEGVARTPDGLMLPVVTEALGPGQEIEKQVSGMWFPTWLNDPGRFREVAEITRREYDERIKGPEGLISNPDINKS